MTWQAQLSLDLKTCGTVQTFRSIFMLDLTFSCGIKIKLMTRHLVQVTLDSIDTYNSPDLRKCAGAANHDPVCDHLAAYSQLSLKLWPYSLQGGPRDKVRTVYENFELNSFSILYFINKRRQIWYLDARVILSYKVALAHSHNLFLPSAKTIATNNSDGLVHTMWEGCGLMTFDGM